MTKRSGDVIQSGETAVKVLEMRFPGKKGDDQGDWVTQATEAIEGAIDAIRDKAVVPLRTVARALVYGLLAAIVGLAALVVFAIAFVRMLYIYLSNIPGAPQGVWLADLVAGAIFVLLGVFFWTKSRQVKS